jgi:hypothetical protein
LQVEEFSVDQIVKNHRYSCLANLTWASCCQTSRLLTSSATPGLSAPHPHCSAAPTALRHLQAGHPPLQQPTARHQLGDHAGHPPASGPHLKTRWSLLFLSDLRSSPACTKEPFLSYPARGFLYIPGRLLLYSLHRCDTCSTSRHHQQL